MRMASQNHQQAPVEKKYPEVPIESFGKWYLHQKPISDETATRMIDEYNAAVKHNSTVRGATKRNGLAGPGSDAPKCDWPLEAPLVRQQVQQPTSSSNPAQTATHPTSAHSDGHQRHQPVAPMAASGGLPVQGSQPHSRASPARAPPAPLAPQPAAHGGFVQELHVSSGNNQGQKGESIFVLA